MGKIRGSAKWSGIACAAFEVWLARKRRQASRFTRSKWALAAARAVDDVLWSLHCAGEDGVPAFARQEPEKARRSCVLCDIHGPYGRSSAAAAKKACQRIFRRRPGFRLRVRELRSPGYPRQTASHFRLSLSW